MVENNNTDGTRDVADAVDAMPSVDSGRRRFNTAGIAASGVLMTLASRSALAACNNAAGVAGPSGVGSLHTSVRPAGTTLLTAGYSPQKWDGMISGENGTPYTDNYLDKLGKPSGFQNPKATMKDVIKHTGDGSDHTEFYGLIAAEYLNIIKISGVTKYLSMDQLKQMATLTFASPAGTPAWDEDKVKCYMKQIQSN